MSTYEKNLLKAQAWAFSIAQEHNATVDMVEMAKRMIFGFGVTTLSNEVAVQALKKEYAVKAEEINGDVEVYCKALDLAVLIVEKADEELGMREPLPYVAIPLKDFVEKITDEDEADVFVSPDSICPVCGDVNLEYEEDVTMDEDDNSVKVSWVCASCGEMGKTIYKPTFECNTITRLGNGEEPTAAEINKMDLLSDGVCPVCKGTLEIEKDSLRFEEDNTIAVHFHCPCCKAQGIRYGMFAVDKLIFEEKQ